MPAPESGDRRRKSDDRGAAPERGIAGRFGTGRTLVKNGRYRIGEYGGRRDERRDRQQFRHEKHESAEPAVVADVPLVVEVGYLAVVRRGTNGVLAVMPEKLVHAFQ